MTGPSNAPRAERPGRPGVTWQTELRNLGEQHIPDDQPEHRPNRATRRAAARTARRRSK